MRKVFVFLFFALFIFVSNNIFAQTEPDMVYVKGGKFLMGSNYGDSDEKPVHSVTVSSYYIGKYEITVAQYQQYFPISPFWNLLASFPRDSVKIVASPFYFESFHWDAARREQISHQRVMPGYLTGVCVEHRWGEVPMGHGFRFQNVGYLGDPNDLIKRGFDLVVYQKPVKVMTNQGEVELGKDTTTCEKALRELFREPVYQDEWLVVFPLSDSLRGQINAAR